MLHASFLCIKYYILIFFNREDSCKIIWGSPKSEPAADRRRGWSSGSVVLGEGAYTLLRTEPSNKSSGNVTNQNPDH